MSYTDNADVLIKTAAEKVSNDRTRAVALLELTNTGEFHITMAGAHVDLQTLKFFFGRHINKMMDEHEKQRIKGTN